MRSLLAAALLPLFSTCAPPAVQRPVTSGGTVAFAHVNLVPMTGDTVLRDFTVIVNGATISRVGPSTDVVIPNGVRVIDGRGRWLMPGLVDAHAHLVVTIGAQPSLRAAWNRNNERILLLGLSQGVTAIIELGGVGLGPDPDRVLPELRREVIGGQRMGPTVYLGWDKANDSTMTRAAGRALVDTARALGYDLVKVYNALSREGYRGIIHRAEQLGMPVTGHVVRSVGFEGTLGSGQRGIAHAEEVAYTYFPFRVSDTLQDPWQVLDTAALPHIAGMIRRSGAWVTPTLVTSETVLAQVHNMDSVLARSEVRLIPRDLYDALWAPGVNPYATRFNHPRRKANLEAGLAFQRLLVSALHAAGVPLLVGTDAPAAGVVPGYALHEELENLTEQGLSPYEALSAATRNPAAFLGRTDFGTIGEGQRADLVLLDANPLASVANARRIAGVMLRGRWLPSHELQRLVDEASR